MGKLCFQVLNAQGKILAEKAGENEVNLVWHGRYEEGSKIVLNAVEKNAFYWVKLDDALEKALLYMKGDMEYQIPFGEKRIHMSPKVFAGETHVLHVRRAYSFEINTYRNLAFNPCDQHGKRYVFPHACANVETRGESVFAAMNAIDGCTVSQSHGAWPYQSWGVNQNPEAVLKLEFGRTVETDRLTIYTRADYPHDNWWEKVTIRFSDGTELALDLVKTGDAQMFEFDSRKIEWMELCNLKKADDPSPFPALTQIEVYGCEVKEY